MIRFRAHFRVSILLFAIIVACLSRQSYAQSIPSCAGQLMRPSNFVDTVFVGFSIDTSFVFFDTSGDTVEINTPLIWIFNDSNSLPGFNSDTSNSSGFTLEPGQHYNYPLNISIPCATQPSYSGIIATKTDSGICQLGTFTFFIKLFPSPMLEFRVLEFDSGVEECEPAITFSNFPDTVQILSISIEDNNVQPWLTLKSETTFPFMLPPGAYLTDSLCANGTQQGSEMPDTLIAVVQTECGLDTIKTGIPAPLAPKASVSNSIATADFSILPNPSTGEVTILLPSETSSIVEIYDILGNRIIRQQATDEFVWTGKTGVYFVRVSSIDGNGSQFVKTKRLVIE